MATLSKVGKIEIQLWRYSDAAHISRPHAGVAEPNDGTDYSRLPEKALKGRSLSHHFRYVKSYL